MTTEGPSGETDANRVTLPVRPRLVTVTVAFPALSGLKLIVLGEATSEKSGVIVKTNLMVL